MARRFELELGVSLSRMRSLPTESGRERRERQWPPEYGLRCWFDVVQSDGADYVSNQNSYQTSGNVV